MNLTLLGINHRTAPVEVREKMNIPEAHLTEAVSDLVHRPGIREGMILSTCNRVEITASAEDEVDAEAALHRFLADHHHCDLKQFSHCFYRLRQQDVVQHLFRVASSLDSMILGEPQILGQMKQAYATARNAGGMSGTLNEVVNQALAVARRVRRETALGSAAVSVSFAAVELAKKIFGGLQDKTVFVVGAGKMSELAAKHILSSGASRILVSNRTYDRAVELAAAFHGTAVPFEQLFERLSEADIVISSTGSREPIIRKSHVEKLLSARRNRPMFFVDIAVPRDIDPAVNQLDNVFVYDIDDLGQVVEANKKQRSREAVWAEEIIQTEVQRTMKRLASRDLVPTIVALEDRLNKIRASEMERFQGKLANLTPEQLQTVDALTRGMMNKILHGPITEIKSGAGEPENAALVRLIHKIFGLGELRFQMRLLIGSRGSKLALWQANWVRGQLVSAGHEVEIRVIKTTGDKLQSFNPAESLPPSMAQTVADVGSKGLFIKEIEEALIDRQIDIAVHSLKDLPTEQPAGLLLGAIPLREDARDVLITDNSQSLMDLPAAARVATSSLRRQTQLRALRPDLNCVAMRGNLDTRVRKLERGDCEALVLAAAGVHRLGLTDRITHYFTWEEMCPAVGQGALAIEIRAEDAGAKQGVQPLDHLPTHQAVRAERAVLRQLGGGCQVPIAAYAHVEEDLLHLQGLVANLAGTRLLRARIEGPVSDPDSLGTLLAEDLLRQGAREILKSNEEPQQDGHATATHGPRT